MIRPVTVVTFLMACGSGLYLYQSKHEVQVLDHTIERVVRETSALREQSRLLATEWTVLNDPERLRQFSDTYLRLKTIAPSQFTSMADLDNRLPAPVVETPPGGGTEDEAVPVTVDTGPQSPPPSAGETVVPEALPVPPLPAPHTAVPAVPPARAADVIAARPADVKAAPRPANADAAPRSAVVSDARPVETRAADQHVAEPRAAQRAVESRAVVREVPPSPVSAPPRPVVLAPVRPTPPAAQAAAVAAAGNTGGSLLGMARAGAPPAPRPTPVNATYNAN